MIRFWEWLMCVLVIRPAERHVQRVAAARFEAWRRDGGVEAGLPSWFSPRKWVDSRKWVDPRVEIESINPAFWMERDFSLESEE